MKSTRSRSVLLLAGVALTVGLVWLAWDGSRGERSGAPAPDLAGDASMEGRREEPLEPGSAEGGSPVSPTPSGEQDDGTPGPVPWTIFRRDDDSTPLLVEVRLWRASAGEVVLAPDPRSGVVEPAAAAVMPDGTCRRLIVGFRRDGAVLRFPELPRCRVRVTAWAGGVGAGETELDLSRGGIASATLSLRPSETHVRIRLPRSDWCELKRLTLHRLCVPGEIPLVARVPLSPELGSPTVLEGELAGLPAGRYMVMPRAVIDRKQTDLSWAAAIEVGEGRSEFDLPAVPETAADAARLRLVPAAEPEVTQPLPPIGYLALRPADVETGGWWPVIGDRAAPVAPPGDYLGLRWHWCGTVGSDGRSFREQEVTIGPEESEVQVALNW